MDQLVLFHSHGLYSQTCSTTYQSTKEFMYYEWESFSMLNKIKWQKLNTKRQSLWSIPGSGLFEHRILGSHQCTKKKKIKKPSLSIFQQQVTDNMGQKQSYSLKDQHYASNAKTSQIRQMWQQWKITPLLHYCHNNYCHTLGLTSELYDSEIFWVFDLRQYWNIKSSNFDGGDGRVGQKVAKWSV